MKKIFTFLVAGLLALSAQAQEGKTYQVKTLTFEDNDYPKDAPNYLGATTWSSLVDNPQYGGELLYGENHGDTSKVSTNVNYKWYDKGNTELYSEIPENWGTKMYWGGGHAISNYWDGNLNNGDYEHQLAVYVADDNGNGQGGHGHNGSNNFCVHYGYKDNSSYSASNLPAIQFGDGVVRVIEGLYINNTTYFVNAITNGNGLTTSLGDKEYVRIEATGYKADGSTLNKYFYLAKGANSFVSEWSYWSLADFGAVKKIEFNVTGTSDNGYGFSQPAYFCYDDVAVRIPMEENVVNAKAERSASEFAAKSEDGFVFTAYNNWEFGVSLRGNVPEGATATFDGDKLLDDKEVETYTIKGLPKNIEIKKIVAHTDLTEIVGSDMEIDAYLDGKHIADLALVCFLSDVQIPNSVEPDQSSEVHDMNLLDKAIYPSSAGELVFKIKSIEGCGGQTATVTAFDITYETVDVTGITDVNSTSNVVEVARFTADGKRISAPQKGINIVRMSDGTTRKVVVK